VSRTLSVLMILSRTGKYNGPRILYKWLAPVHLLNNSVNAGFDYQVVVTMQSLAVSVIRYETTVC